MDLPLLPFLSLLRDLTEGIVVNAECLLEFVKQGLEINYALLESLILDDNPTDLN